MSHDNWNFDEDTLKTIVNRIIERWKEYENESKNGNVSEYRQGLLDGYAQCLDMIENDLESRGYNVDDFR